MSPRPWWDVVSLSDPDWLEYVCRQTTGICPDCVATLANYATTLGRKGRLQLVDNPPARSVRGKALRVHHAAHNRIPPATLSVRVAGGAVLWESGQPWRRVGFASRPGVPGVD